MLRHAYKCEKKFQKNLLDKGNRVEFIREFVFAHNSELFAWMRLYEVNLWPQSSSLFPLRLSRILGLLSMSDCLSYNNKIWVLCVKTFKFSSIRCLGFGIQGGYLDIQGEYVSALSRSFIILVCFHSDSSAIRMLCSLRLQDFHERSLPKKNLKQVSVNVEQTWWHFNWATMTHILATFFFLKSRQW